MKYVWVLIYLVVLVWSFISPKDYLTWVLEVFPALLGGVILLFTYNSFRLTPMVYGLILLHCVVLMVGGHYTYAEVPLFDYLKDVFNWQRNNYDKVGHFVQGFVPVMICREIFIRKKIVNGPSWLNFLSICFCLAFSAFYELLEWFAAILGGESAENFLGTQGYIWDTQSDMGYALIGATIAVVTLQSWHSKQIRSVTAGMHIDGQLDDDRIR